MILLKTNGNHLQMALEAVCQAIIAIREIDTRRRNLYDDARRNGTSEENLRFREKLSDLDREANNAAYTAKTMLDKHAGNYRKDIAAQAYPSGSNLHDENTKGDMWLLEHNLIDTAEELREMRQRYLSPVNPALLRIIENYAEAHAIDAPAFEFETDAAMHMKAHAKLLRLSAEALENVNCGAASTLEGFFDPVLRKADAARFIAWANT